jgi:L-lactate utilization protein LutC
MKMSLLKKLFGSSSEEQIKDIKSRYNDVIQVNLDTIEERFIAHFMKNGGKFLFCENLSEVKDQFLNILEENDWFECDVMCNEAPLHGILEENRLNYLNIQKPVFFFTTCEGLITEEGSVLFSSKQIKNHKPNELPTNIVIFATTNQIVETKSDGLRAIKNKYQTDYPANITTIKYFEEATEQEFLHYGSSAKNIYLLLLED